MANGAIANVLLGRLSAAITVWMAIGPDPDETALCYANDRAALFTPKVQVGERIGAILARTQQEELAIAGRPLIRGHVHDAARSGIGRTFAEELLWRSNRAYEAEIVPVGPDLAALVLYDVTERAIAIHARKEDLRRTLYVLSHDLRKPARHMIGFGEAFVEDVSAGVPFATARGMLEEMKAAGQRLERLLDGILQFAQLGHVDRWEAVSLADVWKDAVIDYVIAVDGANLEPKLVGDPPMVYGSRAMLTQLFANLVANSVKFATAPGVSVSLSAYPCHEVPDRVCVEFVDDGPGIPATQRDEVFTLFRRGRNAKDKPGMGLGLALCRWIAEAHGGSIEILDSKKGAHFLIHLRAVPRQEAT